MPWHQKVAYLIGQPVGVSLTNGQGTSGVLCGTSNGKLHVIEYLYKAQFALKQYDFHIIQDINGFPPCQHQHQQRLY
ncbi:hypothetical protein [Sporosarcina sp. NPDC096371]|uniref:hypothetical protein n=1 Tax=Sporosarcina sp. NPDC096371 TaxID=3364530 RepID=UPI00381656CB